MGLSYHALKMLHLFGVVMFLGNIIVTAWWKIVPDHTRDASLRAQRTYCSSCVARPI